MNKADDSIRLEFFNKFLDSNPVIRSQFHQSLQTRERQQEVTLSPAERREFVHSGEVLYRREMEDLKFENPDWEDYPPRHHGHIPCYDILEDVAKETIEYLFAGFSDEILGGLNNGKVVSSLLRLLALYDTCEKAHMPQADNFIDGYRHLLDRKFTNIRDGVVENIGKLVIPEDWVLSFTETLVDHLQRNYRDDGKFLRQFEPILLKLVNSEPTALAVEKILKKYEIRNPQLPGLFPQLI